MCNNWQSIMNSIIMTALLTPGLGVKYVWEIKQYTFIIIHIMHVYCPYYTMYSAT